MRPRANLAVALALGLQAGCLEYHAPTAGDIDEHDCGACHVATYQRTTAPPHPGRFPTTCDDCHVPQGWTPALEGVHPDPAFPIASGDHAAVRCLDCHQLGGGASQAGANTSCVRCHPEPENVAPHLVVPGYQYDAGTPNFCLSCHPRGVAGHPEDLFPIEAGPHVMPCADCHRAELDPLNTAANTSCTGCHTGEHARGRADSQHGEVGGYRWSDTNPHFCLDCHPRGRH